MDDAQLRVATVKVVPGAQQFGTGLFVGTGLVLTCAHVLEGCLSPEAEITVVWQHKEYPARIVSIRDQPYPDLALLGIGLRNHPVIELHHEVELGDRTYAYGYTDIYGEGDSLTASYEGLTRADRPLLKLKDGQVRPGMSGAGVLNIRTGAVCGILVATRDRNSDLGGRAIPVRTVLSEFPGLVPQSDALGPAGITPESRALSFHSTPALEAVWERKLREQRRLLARGVPGSSRITVGDLLTRSELLVPAPWRVSGRDAERGGLVTELVGRVREQVTDDTPSPRRVLLLSDPGIGKTTLTYCLYSELLRTWSAGVRKDTFPVRIDLRAVATHAIDEDFGSAEWLARYLDRSALGCEPISWVGVEDRDGIPLRPVLILDSLDEHLSRLAYPRMLNELNKFIFGYAALSCCRTQYFNRFLAHSPFADDLEQIELMPWGEQERRRYVHAYVSYCFPEYQEQETRKVRLRIESRPVRDLCQTPLRINMALELMFKGDLENPVINDTLGLYHAYVAQLLQIESAKIGSTLGIEQKLDLLTRIAWHFYDEGEARSQGARLFTLRELHDFICVDLRTPEDDAHAIVEDLVSRSLLAIDSDQFDLFEPTVVRFAHKSFHEYFVARHLFGCMQTDATAAATAFRRFISAEVSEFVKEYLDRANVNSRILARVCDVCIDAYLANRADDARARVARQQLAYYLGNLRSARVVQFLEEALLNEPDLWIQRGIILGLAFGGTARPLEEYVDRLRDNRVTGRNSAENDVNLGYTLTFFGDQPTDHLHPEVDQGLENCEGTIRRITYLVGTETDQECWRLDLLTLVELWRHRPVSRERYVITMRECAPELSMVLDAFEHNPESAGWPEIEELREILSLIGDGGTAIDG
ncbi:trypsin-like peptidase domain-containing protein [Nonomuraea sp. MCN248]|uniref:Trypsin-like peptidase domain-containing protein n=1 Tax=Nonomuraea corallina TaxID=2989783 RepID=A0ABT4S826_9ACTN|nr:serine protease [Nonomuraea corallina]MDA0633317.1 trypsin-like peptidase domain-containing protein [Nonomuraea corallina]